MGDVKKATESLTKRSTFGGETDLVFDGFEVRPLTAKEKKTLEARQVLTEAGKGTTEDTVSITDAVVQSQREAAANMSRKQSSES